MRDSHYTKQERFMILWLRFLTLTFLAVTLLFLFSPNLFLQYIDRIGMTFFNYPSFPLENPRGDIWWVFSLSGPVILAYASFLAQLDWMRHHNLVPMIILAKALTAVGIGALLYLHPAHFFYIVGAGTDGLLCLITLYAYLKAIHSRSFRQIPVA